MLPLKSLLVVASTLLSANARIHLPNLPLMKGDSGHGSGRDGPGSGPGSGSGSGSADSGPEGGLSKYECNVVLGKYSEEIMTDEPCPFDEGIEAMCNAKCARATANAMMALHVAGCPVDMFHCEDDCDGGHDCNDVDGGCYPRCYSSMECDGGRQCRDGFCMYDTEGHPPSWKFGEAAMGLAAGCIANQDNQKYCYADDMLGMGMYYYVEEHFDGKWCDGFRSLGCCAPTYFTFDPEIREKCHDKSHMGEPCELPSWFEEHPDIPDHFNKPMDDFCMNCQPSNWDLSKCKPVASYFCERDDPEMGPAMPYCDSPLCDDYDEKKDNKKEMCHASVRQAAANRCGGEKCVVCGPNGKPIGPNRGNNKWGPGGKNSTSDGTPGGGGGGEAPA